MTTDIIKVVATLAISIVFDSCHNVRETVEEAAVHADVSYDVKESEKEIISATNRTGGLSPCVTCVMSPCVTLAAPKFLISNL